MTIALVGLLWLGAVPGVHAAQSPGASAPAPRPGQTAVAISSGTQAADGEVVLPLSLSVARDVTIGSVDLRIAFARAQLEFVSIEAGGLADSADAEVKGEVQAGASAGEAVLHATISTAGTSARLPIPAGPIAYVTFRISRSAKPESAIPLALEARLATTDNPPKPIAPVATSAGQITVASAPVFGCFFYMH